MAYIKMQDVMKICDEYSQHCFHSSDSRGQDIADRILDDVIELPAADVVEVVRCKDCENNTDNGGDCDRVLIHTHRNLVTETNEYQYFRLNCCEYGKPRKKG